MASCMIGITALCVLQNPSDLRNRKALRLQDKTSVPLDSILPVLCEISDCSSRRALVEVQDATEPRAAFDRRCYWPSNWHRNNERDA
jgi:hypothetical protein